MNVYLSLWSSSSQRVSVREASPLSSVHLSHSPLESPAMVLQPKVLPFKPGIPGYIATSAQDILLPPSSFTVSLAHGKVSNDAVRTLV